MASYRSYSANGPKRDFDAFDRLETFEGTECDLLLAACRLFDAGYHLDALELWRQISQDLRACVTAMADADRNVRYTNDKVAIVCSAHQDHDGRTVDRAVIDITTSGYTDQRCDICGNQMVVQR